MKSLQVFFSIAATFLYGVSLCLGQSNPWDQVPIILSRIREPLFRINVYNIDNFGAVASPNPDDVVAPDATVEANYNAFMHAIGNCSAEGGGTVLVPTGRTYITGAITLKSNVHLLVSQGSVIRFTRENSTRFYPLVFTRWEGIELMNYSPFIYSFEEENVAISGSGTIDGNCDCDHWWPWKGTWSRRCWPEDPIRNQTVARNILFQMAEDEVPVAERVFGDGHYLRPQFIQPYRTKNVLIEGVTITNSPMWIVHPVLCENVIIRNINISSLGPNSDGVDPESCKDVWIKNVTFNNGDDDIAIKSGRNADGRRVGVPSENIVIQDCNMANGHGGLTLGSCCSGGIRNVYAEDCFLSSPSLDTAIRIKNNALRGGLLEGFYLRNIMVGTVAKQVIEVDFFYEEGPNAEFVPIIRDFVVQNLTLLESAPYSLYMRGYPGHPNTSYIGLTLEDATFNGVVQDPHFVTQDVDVVDTTNVIVNGGIWEWEKE